MAVFGISAQSTAMVWLYLVFWVDHCASCIFADQMGRDESQSRFNEQFLQRFRIRESMTCIITRWCLAHTRTHIYYKTHRAWIAIRTRVIIKFLSGWLVVSCDPLKASVFAFPPWDSFLNETLVCSVNVILL